MNRWLAVGAVNGFVAVAAGAFAAHALKTRLEPRLLETFETGARYQMYHALALLFVGLLAEKRASQLLDWAGITFAAGIVLFSGSLYVLALTGISRLGIITPFGGVAFLAGWALLAAAGLRA